MPKVVVKRVYEDPSEDDGYRVLVDRLWPRGVSKERARLDLWFKDASPSSTLRKWFGHDPAKWEEFQKRYRTEVPTEALAQLKEIIAEHKVVTLVYGARDEKHNEAVALLEMVGK